MSVPTAGFSAPREEAPGRPNRILNQYNPGTMLQCIQAAGQKADARALYETANPELVLDSLLATGSRPVARARAMERRTQINTLHHEGLAQADTVVITLGLIEAWYDHEHGVYLNEVPPRPLLGKNAPVPAFREKAAGVAEPSGRQDQDAGKGGLLYLHGPQYADKK